MTFNKSISSSVLLPVFLLLVSCSKFTNSPPGDVYIGRPAIVFYPNFNGSDRNCVMGECEGKVVLIGDAGIDSRDINVSREPLIDASPSTQYILLSTADGYAIYDRGWSYFKNDNASTFTRFIEVDDSGNVLLVSHLGADSNGGGFETGILYGSFQNPVENRYFINGTVVSCEGTKYLFSHGDEGLEKGDLTKREYVFSYEDKRFTEIHRISYYEYDAIYSYGCLHDGQGSFKVILDVSGEFKIASYNLRDGIHNVHSVVGMDQYDYLYERDSMIIDGDYAFLLSQYGQMFKINLESNVAEVVWDLSDKVPMLAETGLGALLEIEEGVVYLLYKSLEDGFVIQEIQHDDGKIVRSKKLKELNKIYGSDIPQLMNVVDIDSLREYMEEGW